MIEADFRFNSRSAPVIEAVASATVDGTNQQRVRLVLHSTNTKNTLHVRMGHGDMMGLARGMVMTAQIAGNGWMTLPELMNVHGRGKLLRRRSWHPERTVSMAKAFPQICVNGHPEPNVGLTTADLAATDWVVA